MRLKQNLSELLGLIKVPIFVFGKDKILKYALFPRNLEEDKKSLATKIAFLNLAHWPSGFGVSLMADHKDECSGILLYDGTYIIIGPFSFCTAASDKTAVLNAFSRLAVLEDICSHQACYGEDGNDELRASCLETIKTLRAELNELMKGECPIRKAMTLAKLYLNWQQDLCIVNAHIALEGSNQEPRTDGDDAMDNSATDESAKDNSVTDYSVRDNSSTDDSSMYSGAIGKDSLGNDSLGNEAMGALMGAVADATPLSSYVAESESWDLSAIYAAEGTVFNPFDGSSKGEVFLDNEGLNLLELGKIHAVHNHNQLRIEVLLQEAIREGNLDKIRWAYGLSPKGKAGILGFTPLRSWQNHAHLLNVLASRAAIRAGVTPEESYRLSDRLFLMVESINDPLKAKHMRYVIARAFGAMVRAYLDELKSHKDKLREQSQRLMEGKAELIDDIHYDKCPVYDAIQNAENAVTKAETATPANALTSANSVTSFKSVTSSNVVTPSDALSASHALQHELNIAASVGEVQDCSYEETSLLRKAAPILGLPATNDSEAPDLAKLSKHQQRSNTSMLSSVKSDSLTEDEPRVCVDASQITGTHACALTHDYARAIAVDDVNARAYVVDNANANVSSTSKDSVAADGRGVVNGSGKDNGCGNDNDSGNDNGGGKTGADCYADAHSYPRSVSYAGSGSYADVFSANNAAVCDEKDAGKILVHAALGASKHSVLVKGEHELFSENEQALSLVGDNSKLIEDKAGIRKSELFKQDELNLGSGNLYANAQGAGALKKKDSKKGHTFGNKALLKAHKVVIESGDSSEDEPEVVKLLRFLVQKRLMESFSLDEIAIELGFSKEHLCRSFKAYYGMTINDYVKRERVKVAKELLRESKLSIKEIASLLHFANPSHLVRVFKDYEDQTPLQFRKAHKYVIEH